MKVLNEYPNSHHYWDEFQKTEHFCANCGEVYDGSTDRCHGCLYGDEPMSASDETCNNPECAALHDTARKNWLELTDLKSKLRIAESNMTDVRSELTHAKANIDVSWCIDLLNQALQQIRKGEKIV